MSIRRTGAVYVIISGLFFGLIGYFGMSIIHAQFSVSTLIFWRFLISTCFMLGVLFVQGLNFYLVRPQCLLRSIAYGMFLYGPSSILYFMAAQKIGSGLAMVLFFIYPAMVMFLNQVFLHHRVSKMYYVALAIIFVGMLCLVQTEGFKLGLVGIGLSLVSAFLFALYMVLNHQSLLPTTLDTFLVCLGSTLSAYFLAVLNADFSVPQTLQVWFAVFGIAVLCTALPILLLLKGLKKIGSLEASILSVLEPIFVVIFGVILLGEKLNFNQVLGITLLLSGALFALLTSE